MDDFTDNWDSERSSIIDDTLNTIRDQRDDAQQAESFGIVPYNPQVFQSTQTGDPTTKPSNAHFLIGPVTFDAPFNSAPTLVFGQDGQRTGETTVSPTATSYVPFLVMPYVYQWNYSNGKVDGFWLGLYALTSPPTGISQQNVHWRAVGEGSPYLDQMTEDTWIDSYDYNNTDFLTVDDGSLDDGVSDGGNIDGSDSGDFG